MNTREMCTITCHAGRFHCAQGSAKMWREQCAVSAALPLVARYGFDAVIAAVECRNGLAAANHLAYLLSRNLNQ